VRPPAYRTPTSFSPNPPRAGAVTRALCIAILATSLVASLTQNHLGFGINTLDFQVAAVLRGQLWRLVTYPFVDGTPLNLIINLVVLWMIGGWFESRWGERDFLRFFFVSCIGAALLAVPLSILFNLILPFRDVGQAQGPGAALNAMFVALALTVPDSNVLFGFVLPVRARTVVFIILGFDLIYGIQTGAAGLSTTLGGMGMGYLLVTGNWRPRRLWQQLREQRRRKRRGFYVVPPRDRTLH
jgi:membrane associated rhomboid family serine protease